MGSVLMSLKKTIVTTMTIRLKIHMMIAALIATIPAVVVVTPVLIVVGEVLKTQILGQKVKENVTGKFHV